MTDLVTSDGLKLFKQTWQAEGKCKATLFLVHGMGEYSGRYEPFIQALIKQGIRVETIDLRGHGKSEGKRGHIANIQTAIDDIVSWIDSVSKDESPRFVMGQSLGGQLVTELMISGSVHFDGVILTSPNLNLVAQVPFGLLTTARILSKVIPSFTMGNQLDLNKLSRDQEQVELYRNDPNKHDRCSLACGVMLQNGVNLDLAVEKWPSIPTLVIHGDADQVTGYEASKTFSSRVGAQFVSLPGAYHETLFELPEVRAKVFKTIGDFILANSQVSE